MKTAIKKLLTEWLGPVTTVMVTLTAYGALFVGGYMITPALGFLILGAAMWLDLLIGALINAGVFTRPDGKQ